MKIIIPTEQMVIDFFKTNGYREDIASRAFFYYEDACPPWTDSTGKKVRSWKSKMRAVWMKDEYKVKPELEPPNYRAEKMPDWTKEVRPEIDVEEMRRVRKDKMGGIRLETMGDVGSTIKTLIFISSQEKEE